MKAQPKIVLAVIALAVVVTDAQAMRWYSPSTGRWFSRDPIGEDGGSNLYVFTINDPVNKRDVWGLITIGFHGAEFGSGLNEGNVKMDAIGNAVGASRMFASLGIGPAFIHLLAHLDTNHDGKYDPSCRDTKEDIKIFGWSWGGTSSVKLARLIKASPKFVDKEVKVVAVIDPVTLFRVPPVVVPSNVGSFWNRYQTRGPSVFPFGFWGRSLGCQPGVNCANQADLNPAGNSLTQRYLVNGNPTPIDHITIIWEVEPELVNLLAH